MKQLVIFKLSLRTQAKNKMCKNPQQKQRDSSLLSFLTAGGGYSVSSAYFVCIQVAFCYRTLLCAMVTEKKHEDNRN